MESAIIAIARCARKMPVPVSHQDVEVAARIAESAMAEGHDQETAIELATRFICCIAEADAKMLLVAV